MKSHVRENLAKAVLSYHLKELPAEGGKIIKPSEYIKKEVLAKRTPNIEYKNWFRDDSGTWMVTVIHKPTGQEQMIQGSDMNDCVNFAEKLFRKEEQM